MSTLLPVSRLRAFAAALVLLSAGGCGGGDDDQGDAEGDAGTSGAAKALAAAKSAGAVPEEIGYSAGPNSPTTGGPPPLTSSDGWYTSKETGARIAHDASKGLEFPLPGSRTASVKPLGISADVSAPILVAKDDGVFFANAYPSTDLILTQFQAGLQEKLFLRSPDAPVQFSWKIEEPSGVTKLEQNGGATGLIKRFKGGFTYPLLVDLLPFPHDSTPPTADSFGTKVEARISVAGERMILDVDHRGHELAYPLFIDLQWQLIGFGP